MAGVTALADAAAVREPVEEERAAKTLLMHYMPWFETPDGRGRWGEHWTGWERQHNPEVLDERGLPDLDSHYHPLVGPYDSADPDLLEYQLLLMKLAGVDGVIVDWYGTRDAADYASIHEATQAMFAACEEFGLSFTVCFEDRTAELLLDRGQLQPDEIPDYLAETFAWTAEHWFGADHYFKVDGRPLLLNFGPVFVKDPAAWAQALDELEPRPLWFGLHHLWKDAGADGGFTWAHPKAWEGDPSPQQVRAFLSREHRYTTRNPKKMIPSAIAGFHDIYKDSFDKIPHRDGETLRESLGVAMSGAWPIVQLVTWNDYGEGTMLEPTHEFGYTFLEIIQAARRDEQGSGFGFVAADLRLPVRLYELRKSGVVDDSSLDAVSGLLRNGRVAEARVLLQELGE